MKEKKVKGFTWRNAGPSGTKTMWPRRKGRQRYTRGARNEAQMQHIRVGQVISEVGTQRCRCIYNKKTGVHKNKTGDFGIKFKLQSTTSRHRLNLYSKPCTVNPHANACVRCPILVADLQFQHCVGNFQHCVGCLLCSKQWNMPSWGRRDKKKKNLSTSSPSVVRRWNRGLW